MEMIYTALVLNSLGKKITEANVKKVLQAAGGKPDEAKIKALVASLEGVDINEVISQAAVVPTAAPAPSGEVAPKEEKKEEKAEEDAEKKAEEAVSGLASLFG